MEASGSGSVASSVRRVGNRVAAASRHYKASAAICSVAISIGYASDASLETAR
jgi:hypothetical protein